MLGSGIPRLCLSFNRTCCRCQSQLDAWPISRGNSCQPFSRAVIPFFFPRIGPKGSKENWITVLMGSLFEKSFSSDNLMQYASNYLCIIMEFTPSFCKVTSIHAYSFHFTCLSKWDLLSTVAPGHGGNQSSRWAVWVGHGISAPHCLC